MQKPFLFLFVAVLFKSVPHINAMDASPKIPLNLKYHNSISTKKPENPIAKRRPQFAATVTPIDLSSVIISTAAHKVVGRFVTESAELNAKQLVKRLVIDINAVKTSADPLATAYAVIKQPFFNNASLQYKPYLQVIAEIGDPELFKTFMNANAPIEADSSCDYPLDRALRADSTEIINAICESENPKIMHLRTTTLTRCNQEKLLSFCAQFHAKKAHNPSALLYLSDQILPANPNSKAREYIKKGFLQLPSYQDFCTKYSLTAPHLPHNILKLYALSSSDLPLELYKAAQRCALASAIWTSPCLYGIANVANILKQYPITFTADDIELAWYICAYALTVNAYDLNNTIISLLEQQKLPLPDADFSIRLLKLLISLDKNTVLLDRYLNTLNTDINHVPSEKSHSHSWTPAWMPAQSSLKPYLLATALHSPCHSAFTQWLLKNGLRVTPNQWLQHIQALDPSNTQWLSIVSTILTLNPLLKLDPQTIAYLQVNLFYIEHSPIGSSILAPTINFIKKRIEFAKTSSCSQ